VFGETDFGVTAIGGIVALGVFQLALAYIFMSKGLDEVPAVTASLTTAIEPILNPIWVAIFFHEMITPLAFVGAVIVITAVVGYNVWKAVKTT
jgi:drug/metabolite transporter (DMT)-like permease